MRKYLNLLLVIETLMFKLIFKLMKFKNFPLKEILLKNKHFLREKSNNTIQKGKNEGLTNHKKPPSYYISHKNLKERKKEYLDSANKSNGLYAQCAKVYLNEKVYNKVKIKKSIDKINNREDTADFDMNALLRMMYLDKGKNNIPNNLNESINKAILNFKYWFTESGPDEMIFWTENHMILFHTAELLAGNLYPSQIFINNNQNGKQHVKHALPLINQWLDWRAKFGFAEWHSNIYYVLDLIALLNLVDFAPNKNIAKKAEMLIDLIGFDFANNYYKGVYATAHGRTSDELQFGKNMNNLPEQELTADLVWLMLGVGYHNQNSGNNSAAVFFATSKYRTPKILENIAHNITKAKNYVHKSRNNIEISQGLDYGIGYRKSNLNFWWSMSAPATSPLLEPSLKLIDEYDLDPKLVYNDEAFLYLLKIGSLINRTSLNNYSALIKDITQGVALETANTYTYKTPYYQLSGVQDHQKGMNGLQELIWQARLDEYATITTSSPSALTAKKQLFTSGWKPRTTLYKNVGIIQYDRQILSLELELVMQFLGEPSYNHAYFPRWAFNEWNRNGNWVFGRRNDSYVALYSYNPIKWKNEYELRAEGKKNVWIIELGSINESGSYKDYRKAILNAKIQILEKSVGYEILYESPSQGEIRLGWNKPMYVNKKEINLGPYERFDNPYCNQAFGTLKTIIEHNGQKLKLDFENMNKKEI